MAQPGVTGRTRILAFREGYHGDTLGAMSVCDPEEGMHRRFGAYLPAQVFCDLPRTATEVAALDATLAAERETLAAVIVEPLVQGAGGMRMHPPEVLATVARLAARHGLPLIADGSSRASAAPAPCSPASRLASCPTSCACRRP